MCFIENLSIYQHIYSSIYLYMYQHILLSIYQSILRWRIHTYIHMYTINNGIQKENEFLFKDNHVCMWRNTKCPRLRKNWMYTLRKIKVKFSVQQKLCCLCTFETLFMSVNSAVSHKISPLSAYRSPEHLHDRILKGFAINCLYKMPDFGFH